MKTNGIIRKVDGLGRVVIPREFRKLNKISLGDPMEISCLDSGEIVLRKMDMTLTLEELSSTALRVLSDNIRGTVLVSGTEKWISGVGADKGKFIGRELPEEIKQHIRKREDYSVCDVAEIAGLDVRFEGKTAFLAEPISGDSDVFGALYITGTDSIPEAHITLLKTAAVILGSSLQKF